MEYINLEILDAGMVHVEINGIKSIVPIGGNNRHFKEMVTAGYLSEDGEILDSNSDETP